MPALPEANTVHVWLAFESLLDDPANAERITALMTDEELARDRRFLVEPAKRLNRLARGLQREVLSSYLPGTTPRDLRFVAGKSGRPALAPPFDASGLDFNLAHTRGLAALAITRGRVGLDVEIHDKKVPLAAAQRYFSAAEAEELQSLPADAQPRRFLRLWTLKESYLKALGTGIAGGLDTVSFRLGEEGGGSFECAAESESGRWCFSQFDVADSHLLALAHQPVGEPGAGTVVEWHEYRRAATAAAARITALFSGQEQRTES